MKQLSHTKLPFSWENVKCSFTVKLALTTPKRCAKGTHRLQLNRVFLCTNKFEIYQIPTKISK